MANAKNCDSAAEQKQVKEITEKCKCMVSQDLHNTGYLLSPQ